MNRLLNELIIYLCFVAKNYLNALRYDNAIQDDLWDYLTLAANSSVNVKVVMDSWTLQDGYPVVTLTRNYNDRTASLTQKRFLLSTLNESSQIDTSKYSWEIPITYTHSRNTLWQPITKLWMHTHTRKYNLNDHYIAIITDLIALSGSQY